MARDSSAFSPDIEDYFDDIEARTQFSEVLDLLSEWRSYCEQAGDFPEPSHFEDRFAGPGGANLMLLRHGGGDFQYEVVGKAIPALFGHNPHGRNISELPYPGAQAYMARYRSCLDAGQPLFSIQRKAVFGIPGATERLLLPLRMPDGAAGLLVYVRSRADNYDLIRAVFNASQHGVLAVSAVRDPDGVPVDLEVLAVNVAAASLVGGEPNEMIGQRLRSRLSKSVWDSAWPELLTSLETGDTRVFELDEPNTHMPGIYRISSASLGDGLAITISDLTQLHRAMQTLETQHATLVKVNAELRSEVGRRRRLEAELKQQAATDPLTGISNRRGFTDAMTSCFEVADVDGERPALIMFDIDDFKSINDSFGHPAGDAVLKQMTDAVSRKIDGQALFGRLGGEEFAVFLPKTTPGEALALAELLRRSIADSVCTAIDSEVKLTASFGVAIADHSSCAIDELILRADDALYKAKRGGRNRVENSAGAFGQLGALDAM